MNSEIVRKLTIYSEITSGLLFIDVAKQVKATAAGSGGWPSAAVAIRTIRVLRSFQDYENQPRFFWLLFSAMEKSNNINFKHFTTHLYTFKKQFHLKTTPAYRASIVKFEMNVP